mgnify:FL=1
MSKSLTEVVYDSDKQVGNARNALAKLFRTILLERRISHQNVDHYLQRYLNDPNNHISKNSKDRSSERGNLLKQLGKDTITWKIFIKGLKLLRPRHIKIIVEFTGSDGDTTVHSVDLTGYIDDPNEYTGNEENEDEED